MNRPAIANYGTATTNWDLIHVGPRRDKTALWERLTEAQLYGAAALAELERLLTRDLNHPQVPSRSFIRQVAHLAKAAGVKLGDVVRRIQGGAIAERAAKHFGESAIDKEGKVTRGKDAKYIGDVGKDGRKWTACTPEPNAMEQGDFKSRAEAASWLLLQSVL